MTMRIGLGFPTLVPTNGNVTMDTTGFGDIGLSGLIFDAGPKKSPALLQLGWKGFPLSVTVYHEQRHSFEASFRTGADFEFAPHNPPIFAVRNFRFDPARPRGPRS